MESLSVTPSPARAADEQATVAEVRAGMRSASTGALSRDRPFPGLRPYTFADHEWFFGRQTQVLALYRLLVRSRFTAVVGSSGSGKSSLVRAGLLPLLREETGENKARH